MAARRFRTTRRRSATAISNSTLQSNAAGNGGGVYSNSTATISGSTLQSNTAGSSGGGVFANSTATIISSTLQSNTATSGGGVYGSTATISGSTLQSNRAAGSGGGVFAASTATISGSMIQSNTATSGSGGGVRTGSAATISSSTILSNTAGDNGGGVYAGSAATISDSTILSNTAGGGGGGVRATTATISGSTILSNTATSSGGGVTATTATISGSTILSNTAGLFGGGVRATTATISGSTLTGNRSTGSAGGAVDAPTARFTNATIAGNSGVTGGGAVQFSASLAMTNTTVTNNGANAISGTATTVPFTLTDSIVGGVPAPACSHAGTLTGKNVVEDTSCGTGAALIQANANLGPLKDNGGPTWTMAPLPGSPAIGVASACLLTDQRGVSRVAPCDSGAYESGIAPTLTSLSPNAALVGGAGFTLTVTGSGFISGTVALWAGAPRPTVVVSTTALQVTIPASDISAGGVVTVAARYGSAGDSTSNALPFTVTKLSQSISFAQPPDRAFGTPPFPVTATASSGLPVFFTASGACSVASDLVTITGAGACTITATQAGNASYTEAPSVARTFAIAKASQTITFAPLTNRTFGDQPFPVTATASSGLPVFFTASGACSVASGLVTITGAGSCTITATQAGNSIYAEAPSLGRTFVIAKANQTITFAPLTDRAATDPPFVVTATASSGLPVAFSASGACTMVGATVTLTGAGVCTITASQAGNSSYNAAADVPRSFTVTSAGGTGKIIMLPVVVKAVALN